VTGPELYELGSSIIKDIKERRFHASDDAGKAAVAAACFAGAQAAAFAVMATMELDGEDSVMSQAWAKAAGLSIDSAERVA
jgi:hypothetical protein